MGTGHFGLLWPRLVCFLEQSSEADGRGRGQVCGNHVTHFSYFGWQISSRSAQGLGAKAQVVPVPLCTYYYGVCCEASAQQ